MRVAGILSSEDDWVDASEGERTTRSKSQDKESRGNESRETTLSLHEQLVAISWNLDRHPVYVNHSTLMSDCLHTVTTLDFPMPRIDKPKYRPGMLAVGKWLEDLLSSLYDEADSEVDALALWIRHVAPFCDQSLASHSNLVACPLGCYSIEVSSLFVSRHLIWVKGKTCSALEPAWLLVGSILTLPLTDGGLRRCVLLVIHNSVICKFAEKLVSDPADVHIVH